MTKFTRPITLGTIAALAAATLPAAAMAAEVQIQANGPVVEVSMTETVEADPDVVNLSAGVTTLAPTAVEAMRQNAAEMERVIRQIEAQGVDEDDIQTTGVNLNAEYDYDDQTRGQVFRGYRVSNRVQVTLRDIDRTGRVLDALVQAGATDLGGIQWSIDDPAPAQEQARQAAFRSARERALGYARLAGYSDIRLLEVNEAVTNNRPMPYAIVPTAARAEMADTPVRPGQVETGVTITVKYEMVQ